MTATAPVFPLLSHFIKSEREVRNPFRRQNFKKVPGPEGMYTPTLMHCPKLYYSVFTDIFNTALCLSLLSPVVLRHPSSFLSRRRTRGTSLNHYRQVALISVVMKALERLILRHLICSSKEKARSYRRNLYMYLYLLTFYSSSMFLCSSHLL